MGDLGPLETCYLFSCDRVWDMVFIHMIKTILVIVLISYLNICFGMDRPNRVGFEIVIPYMESEHNNQCKPKCLRQKNGGSGFIIRYERLDKGGVNMAFGKICFTNSYSDPGCADFFQFTGTGYKNRLLELEINLWRLRITGYKREIDTKEWYLDSEGNPKTRKEYRDKVVDIPLWPIPKIGINPLYAVTDGFKINAYFFFTPDVRIIIPTISYEETF